MWCTSPNGASFPYALPSLTHGKCLVTMIDATSSQAYEARGLWDARRSQGLWSFGEDLPAHSAPRLLITEHRSIRQSRGKASPR